MTAQIPAPSALIVLDGWGHSDDPTSNAIAAANTPTWDRLWREAPTALVDGSGLAVGLPDGQMGNSEVGHMNIGAGRVVYQDFTRIGLAISDGSFASNPTIVSALAQARATGGNLHVFGLLSPGGVHSHEDHIHALVEIAAEQGVRGIQVHAFLDGRDTPPRSAAPSITALQDLCDRLPAARIASLSGRYYAMDRDQRWERVAEAWSTLVDGSSDYVADSAAAGLAAAYERDESDEFVRPTVVRSQNDQPADIKDGDVVIYMNFRADRARQLTRAFVDSTFDGFAQARVPKLADFVMLTQYSADLDCSCAFPPSPLTNTLGEYIANLGQTQLRIAETEKYAHVTFFFSGGREEPFPGEERQLIPSPNVATYDLQPEMSAPELTDRLVAAIEGGAHDVIVCNYANPDMVGHTGDFAAAVVAVETIDACLARIEAALLKVGGQALITADHGNVEFMSDPATGQAHTAHTCEPVPLVYIGARQPQLIDGTLADLAPTLLALMGLAVPSEMTGHPLLADTARTTATSHA